LLGIVRDRAEDKLADVVVLQQMPAGAVAVRGA
jgi:hypothetical protein